ncbi:MAG: RluA family pseudouridine synthase [Clostridia bacterium]
MTTEVFNIEDSDAGIRLDVFLSAELEEYTRSRVKSAIQKGRVKLNGAIADKAGISLKKGDEIQIELEDIPSLEAVPQDLSLDIIYQDDDLAVINKAKGMVTHPAAGSPSGTLANAILYHIKDLSKVNGAMRPGIVHRLDKDTSGLIVVAKNDDAHYSLAEQIANKSAVRSYLALSEGNIKEDEGVIEERIGRSKNDRKKMAVTADGRYALTKYKVIERLNGYTLAEYTLFTGRTHQIRVHAKFIHHPIVGDKLYGNSDKFKLEGQLLHAYKLAFLHPVTGKQLCFNAPLPEYFTKVLESLNCINKM